MRLYSLLRAVALLFSVWGVSIPEWAHAAYKSDWTTRVTPFRIADNLYYVGSRDLAAYLVTTPAGNILINANLPTSPSQIQHSVEQLGFRWRNTKILLISHAHVDHAGGAAAIIRETGATLEVMRGDVEVMESGGVTDFAFGHQGKLLFPPVHVSHVLADNSAVTLGGATLVAHRTPGHTRGCTTWTMRAHMAGDPAGRLRDVVIGGSWTVLSEYHLLDDHHRPASYPGIADDFRRTFALLHTLPCDVFLSAHGEAFDMLAKLQRMPAEGEAVWLDAEGYRQAVNAAQSAFEAALQLQSTALHGTPHRHG